MRTLVIVQQRERLLVDQRGGPRPAQARCDSDADRISAGLTSLRPPQCSLRTASSSSSRSHALSRTSRPQALSLAATFNESLWSAVGRVSAEEARAPPKMR
eukprot:4944533-Prymnesium_polylepis.3